MDNNIILVYEDKRLVIFHADTSKLAGISCKVIQNDHYTLKVYMYNDIKNIKSDIVEYSDAEKRYILLMSIIDELM
jgi:hypothetical protein